MVYLCLQVELIAKLDEQTGFVVNVVDIDKAVRGHVVPMFDARISESFRNGRHIGLDSLAGLLRDAWGLLKDKFDNAELTGLGLELNPGRKMVIRSEDLKVISISEKFEFAATHKLWNESFSDEKNFEVFGKCANPNGHGHNYIVEVTVNVTEPDKFMSSEMQSVVNREFVTIVDHRNLNEDVKEFFSNNPTVENITTYAWGCLVGKFNHSKLASITIWESDRMYCTYSGFNS